MTTVTWNPSDKSANITLSNGDLTATDVGGGALGVRANISKTTGKYYFEFTVVSNGYDNYYDGVGVTKLSQSLGNSYAGRGGCLITANTEIVVNDANILSANSNNLQNGDIVCIAVDLDNQRFWSRTLSRGNGYWNGNASYDPATNTGGVDISGSGSINNQACAPSFIINTAHAVTANFGATAFSQTAPSGFTPWGGVAGPTGTLDVTEAVDVFAGTGVAGSTGTWASTEATDVCAATGVPGLYGAWASTEAADVMDATGVLETFGGIVGSFEGVEAKDVFSAAGYPVVVGVMATTEAKDQFHAFGKITIIGTFTPTEAKDVFSGTGHIPGQTGIWASNEPVDRMTATGNVPRVGTWASTENRDTAIFTGLGSTGITARRIFFVT